MLKRLLMALPYVVLGAIATSQVAHADFNPSDTELSIGTFVLVIVLMAFLTVVYAIASYFRINRPDEVEIPDHAHDHRYAHQHSEH